MKASVSRFTLAASRLAAAFLSLPIRAYMRFLSPLLPARCRYHPTCSAYALQAIRELGPVRGAIVAGWRLARCNPWSKGGYDPVSARRLFADRDPAGSNPHSSSGAAA